MCARIYSRTNLEPIFKHIREFAGNYYFYVSKGNSQGFGKHAVRAQLEPNATVLRNAISLELTNKVSEELIGRYPSLRSCYSTYQNGPMRGWPILVDLAAEARGVVISDYMSGSNDLQWYRILGEWGVEKLHPGI